MSQQPYMWNNNNPVMYADPSGYEGYGPGLQGLSPQQQQCNNECAQQVANNMLLALAIILDPALALRDPGVDEAETTTAASRLAQNYARGMVKEDEVREELGAVRQTFNTPLGARKVDAYVASSRTAVEVKTGYQTRSTFIDKQVEKDSYLLKNHIVDKVEWVFYGRGPSKPLQDLLTKYHITFKILK